MPFDPAKADSRSTLETMIAYSGEATEETMVAPDLDLALFKRLNREYESMPVVPAPRPHSTDYGIEIGRNRGNMLERRIGIRDLRVLEIGCGASAMSRVLARDFGCEVVGVDISHYDAWERPLEGKLKLLVHDVTSADNSQLGSFDRVISFAVLEHVVHPHAAIKAAYDMLKPGGKAYLYANLYRGAKASHRYREVFFPWPHLLFKNSVWREFYNELTGEPMEPAWVNKLTYDQYINTVERVGFRILDHFPSKPYFDEDFYRRFEYQLAAYPRYDLMHDFVHLVLEKPRVDPSFSRGLVVSGGRPLLSYLPRGDEDLESYGATFWKRVHREEPAWSRFEAQWYMSRRDDASSIDDMQPGVSFPAIEFLNGWLRKPHRIFEWGSGGSTLFFQQRVDEVISIEHDAGRYNRVNDLLKKSLGSDTAPGDCRLIEPHEAAPESTLCSRAFQCGDLDFENYVRVAEDFDDASFDLVVINGRARVACLKASVDKVAPGGMLLLNNANCPRYAKSFAELIDGPLRDWRVFDLSGPGPYSRTPCWQTLILCRPLSLSGAESDKSEPNRATLACGSHGASPVSVGDFHLSNSAVAAVRAALAAQPLRSYDRISYLTNVLNIECAEKALAGEPFELFGLTFRLSDDFDWYLEEGPRSRKLFLHSWLPFEPLFIKFDETGDSEALKLLLSLVRSWLEEFGNLPLTPVTLAPPQSQLRPGTDFLSSDTALANRFYRLAYLVAATADIASVSDEDFAAILESARLHADALSLKENYSPSHNHGLYQAMAQVCGASRFSSLVDTRNCERIGRDMLASLSQGEARLTSLLANHFSIEGAHKEHSPFYHVVITNSLRWIVDHKVIITKSLVDFVSKAQEISCIMHDCAGDLANLGDSDLEPRMACEWSEARIDDYFLPKSIVLEQAGYWFVKGAGNAGHTYLAQTAAFHSRVHKQADTGAFLWRDRGRDILIDAGRYGYVGRTEVGSGLFRDGFWYADPRRVYVESTRAHNTLAVDGRNHPRFRAKAFGSGMRATAEKDGVFACEALIPNLPRMSHFRILVLRPGAWLLCIDSIRAPDDAVHSFRQHFHLHPDWSLVQMERQLGQFRLADGPTLYLAPLFAEASIVDHARGRGDPETGEASDLFGWWSPRHMHIEPCNSLAIEATGSHVTMATLFSFGPIEIDREFTGFNITRRRLRFRWEGEQGVQTLTLDRSIDGSGHRALVIL